MITIHPNKMATKVQFTPRLWDCRRVGTIKSPAATFSEGAEHLVTQLINENSSEDGRD